MWYLRETGQSLFSLTTSTHIYIFIIGINIDKINMDHCYTLYLVKVIFLLLSKHTSSHQEMHSEPHYVISRIVLTFY